MSRPAAVGSGPSDAQLADVAARLGAALLDRGWLAVTAESSTAGLIGHAITMIPGASRYYPGGVIAYSDWAKEVELAVDAALLATHGAVSPEVAAAMAEGARARFDADLGIAVTGIAGPEGAAPGKPVGLHFVAAVRRGHPPRVERHQFGLDRDGNKAAAAQAALELAIAEVQAA